MPYSLFSLLFLFFVTEIEKRTTVSVPDVISIERTNEFFRILYDSKGRFVVHRIKPEEAKVRQGFLDCLLHNILCGLRLSLLWFEPHFVLSGQTSCTF